MCICKYKCFIGIGTFDESSKQRGHFWILVRGGISEYFLIQRWHLWVHGEWWYRGGIAMGTTSAAPSLWIKAAPCLHQKLIHPHHFCPFKLLSLLPALNYLMPSSSILLLQNCVIFIRWISSIWTPRVIPFLSHKTFLYKQSTVSSWKSSLFNQSSNNLRTMAELFSVWFQNCVNIFQVKDQIVSRDTNIL